MCLSLLAQEYNCPHFKMHAFEFFPSFEKDDDP